MHLTETKFYVCLIAIDSVFVVIYMNVHLIIIYKTYTLILYRFDDVSNDCVLIRSSNPDPHPHEVARVERLQIVNKFNVNGHIRWY